MGRTNLITVIDVFRELGLETDKDKTWAVGNAVMRRYQSDFGCQPMKDNRPKTNGEGSHCFALYPDSYRPIIRQCIESVHANAARQTDMFMEAAHG